MYLKLFAHGYLGVAYKSCCNKWVSGTRNVHDHLMWTFSRMKTSRVHKVYPDFEDVSMTKTSKFIHFLLRICFLAVIQKDDKILFSKYKTSIYIFLTFCWLMVIAIVSFLIGANGVMETYNKERSTLQEVIWMITMGISSLGAVNPIILRWLTFSNKKERISINF